MSSKKSLSDDSDIVAGMKQFLGSLNPIIEVAGSYEVLIDILKHLEESDKDFHKHALVKHLQEKVDSALGPLVDEEIKNFSLNVEDGVEIVVSKITEIIAESSKYKTFLQQIRGSISSASDQLSQNLEDIPPISHGLRKQSFLSGSSLDSSFNQDGIIFYSPQQFEKMAENLGSKKSLELRRKVMLTLSQVPAIDIISCEHWKSLKKGLLECLSDSDEQLMEKCLKFHEKALNSSVSNISREFYINIVEHLTSLFLGKKSAIPKLCDGLDLNQVEILRLIRKFRLINQFYQTIPQLWIRYTDRYIQAIVDCTFSFLSISSYLPSGSITPFHCLSLVDPKAVWIKQWMHGNYSRTIVLQVLAKSKHLIELCRHHCIFIAQQKLEVHAYKSNKVPSNTLIYKPQDLDYFLFVHSLYFIGHLFCYSEGRKLFPVKLDNDSELMTIKDFLDAMASVLQQQTIISVSRRNEITCFTPEFVVLDFFHQLLLNEGSCQACLCHDSIINALVYPLKILQIENSSYLQGRESFLLHLSTVLQRMINYNSGYVAFLFGQLQTSSKNISSACDLIFQFCIKAVLGELNVSLSLEITTSFLKVCILLLSSYDGFYFLETKNLHETLTEAWTLACQESGNCPTPIPPLSLNFSNKLIFTDELLETLLNFTRTPQGVTMLHSVDMLTPCMEYLFENHINDILVGRYEVFITLSHVAATALGFQTLSKCGILQWIIRNVWENVECKEDAWPCIPKSYPTDIIDKTVAKWFHTLLCTMTSNSVIDQILYEETKYEVDYSHRVVPQNFYVLLKRLIFSDLDIKKMSLFNYEQSYIFGLRLLNSLIFNLDFLIFFESHYSFQELLLSEQSSCILEDGNEIIIDMLVLERNYILVKSYLIGGPSEKILPSRKLNSNCSQYEWPLFTSFPVPSVYIAEQSYNFNEADENNISELFNILEDSLAEDNWKDIFHDALKQIFLLQSNTVCIADLFNIIIKIVLKMNKISSDIIDLSCIPEGTLSNIEFLGIDYTIRYGQLINAVSNKEEDTSSLKKINLFLKQHFSQPDIKMKYSGYDWFVSTIFLMSSCDLFKSLQLLNCLSISSQADYLWMTKLYQKFQIHPIFSALCHSVNHILQTEVPLVFSAFKMSRCSSVEICQQWIQQCFWNVLDWSEIYVYISLCLLFGKDYQVYYCVAVLQHLQPAILKYSQSEQFLSFLKDEPVKNFQARNYFQFMEFLQEKYHHIVMYYLSKYV